MMLRSSSKTALRAVEAGGESCSAGAFQERDLASVDFESVALESEAGDSVSEAVFTWSVDETWGEFCTAWADALVGQADSVIATPSSGAMRRANMLFEIASLDLSGPCGCNLILLFKSGQPVAVAGSVLKAALPSRLVYQLGCSYLTRLEAVHVKHLSFSKLHVILDAVSLWRLYHVGSV